MSTPAVPVVFVLVYTHTRNHFRLPAAGARFTRRRTARDTESPPGPYGPGRGDSPSTRWADAVMTRSAMPSGQGKEGLAARWWAKPCRPTQRATASAATSVLVDSPRLDTVAQGLDQDPHGVRAERDQVLRGERAGVQVRHPEAAEHGAVALGGTAGEFQVAAADHVQPPSRRAAGRLHVRTQTGGRRDATHPDDVLSGKLLGAAWVIGFGALFLAITGLTSTLGMPDLQAVLWPTGSGLRSPVSSSACYTSPRAPDAATCSPTRSAPGSP